MLFALLIGWTMVMAALLFWRLKSRQQETGEMAYLQAKVALGKDLLYRKWNSNHGGVYILTTEETPPNPYLEHIADRDITTTSGKKLTLVNPAYMTRQVNEYEAEISEIRSHLISLKPVNPINIPDQWEQKSLETFQKGEKESSVIDTINGQPYFRLIQPFFVDKACLKCHDQHEYKENDILGGISISIPMEPLLTVEAGSKKQITLIYGFIWILGIGGISLSFFKLDRSFQRQTQAEMAVRKAYSEIEQKVAERTRDLNEEIAERKILQENLAMSDQYNRMLFEQSAIGLALTTLDGRLVDINSTFASIIGHTVEEAKALTYWDITPEKYQEQEQQQIDLLSKTGQYGPYEKEYIHKDGHLVPVRLKGLIIERNNEKFIWSSVEDITKQKHAENLLHQSEERLSKIFQLSPSAIVVSRITDGIILDLNEAACIIFGYSREEIIGRSSQELGIIDAGGHVRLVNAVETGGFLRNQEVSIHSRNQGDRIVFYSMDVIKIDGERCMLTSMVDITERKQIEKELDNSRERLDFALNQSRTGGWELDLIDQTAYRTLMHDQIFGYQTLLPEWTYPMFLEHVVPEDRDEVDRLFKVAVENKSDWNFTCRILRKDGEIRWIWAAGSHQPDTSGEIRKMAGIVQDITERKEIEIEQTRLFESEKAALIEATKAKEQLSQILDRISDGFGSLDRNWNYTFVNEQLARNVNKKREDLLGQNIWEVFPQAIGTAVHQAYLRAMEEQKVIDLEHYYPPFGKWFQHRFYPSPDGISVFSKDITESRLAEEKIREKNSLIRIAAEKAKLGGWNVDLKENRSYWSDEVAAIHEMPPGYAPLVEDGINFYAPEWRERIIKVFTECAKNGVPYDEEMEIIASSGRRVWVRTIGEAVRDESGKIIKVEGAFQDISEQKIAEAKIREKDLQFRKLSANVPDLIFQFTRKPDGSYCVPVASEGIRNIFGCTPEAVVDDFTPIGKVIYPEDAERVIADIENSANRLTHFSCEFRVQIPGKPIQWILSRSTPEQLPDGSITWYGFNADITQRKEFEDALRESEGKFRKIYEEGPFGMLLVNSSFKFIMVNSTFCKITGYSESELRELTFRDITYPDDKDIGIESIQKLIKGEIPVFKSEKRYVRKDGTVIWGAITVTANFDKDGNFLYNVAIVEDISGRKQSEEKIKTLNVRLQLLVEAIQKLSVSTSMESIMETVRTSARNLVNADGSTFILRDNEMCFYADEDTVSPLWKGQRFPLTNCISGWAMLHKQPVIVEDIYADDRIPVEAYQSTFVKSLAIAPIRLNDPLGAIGVYWGGNYSPSEMEVTLLNTLADAAAKAVENVQLIEGLEQKISERTTQLQTVNKELETFTYSVSHDLKAPLRGIDGYSKLLSDLYANELNDEAKRFITVIRNSTLQMNQLIEDLLQYSRLERSQRRNEVLHIRQLVDSVIKVNQEEMSARNFRIENTIPDISIFADSGGIQIALRNLIGNAIKFTQSVAEPVLSLHLNETPHSWTVSVSDNGIGFDMKYHQRIFEIFQRLQRAEDYPGTGIGLAMVSKAMQRMNGKVWAESAPGKGATFYLEIPKPN